MRDVNAYNRQYYAENKTTERTRKTALMQKYRAKNPDKYRSQSRESKKRLRQKVLDAFGRLCINCGFPDERALTLDHKLNNGAQERVALGERGVYLRALKPEHRHEYQILCMNCQFIARHEAGRQNQWLEKHGKD